MSRYSPQRHDYLCLLCAEAERVSFSAIAPLLDHLEKTHEVPRDVSGKATGRLTLSLDARDGYSNTFVYTMADGTDIIMVCNAGGRLAMTEEERLAAKGKKKQRAARK